MRSEDEVFEYPREAIELMNKHTKELENKNKKLRAEVANYRHCIGAIKIYLNECNEDPKFPPTSVIDQIEGIIEEHEKWWEENGV